MKAKIEKIMERVGEYNFCEFYVVKVRQYGFWIRFAHKHFIPCEKCQDKLDELLTNMWHWEIYKPMQINFWYYKDKYYLSFSWLNLDKFELCGQCMVKLIIGIKDANEWTIGNKEYDPPIELWRKWDIDDKRTQQLEKAEKEAKAIGIHINSFRANLRNKKTTKELDAFFDEIQKALEVERRHDNYKEMVDGWIESGYLIGDKPRTEDEARDIAFDLLKKYR